MPNRSANSMDACMAALQIMLIFVCFLLPVCYLMLALLLWFSPLPARVQQVGFACARLLGCWSAIDVFVITCVAMRLQVSTLASIFMMDFCNAMEDTMALVGPRPTCEDILSVTMTLGPGFVPLAVAATLASLGGQGLIHRCSAALRNSAHQEHESWPEAIVTPPARALRARAAKQREFCMDVEASMDCGGMA